MRILLVEDEQYLAKTLNQALVDQNYVVDFSPDGQAGWEQSQTFPYDLIILNLCLPNLNGIDFCRQLRCMGDRTPVLIVATQDSAAQKVMVLDAGADDYVVYPFDKQELLARIRALLRRGSLTVPPILNWEGLCCNTITCEVTYGGHPLELTAKEYRLIELFVRNGRRVWSRSAILDRLWPTEEIPQEETIKTHIKRLRQKLQAIGAPSDLIETVYGLGYRLKQESQV
ncbi:response regulator transcription factor [Coleofasciculus sp. FACHB-64]|uniref:response regulator transcription factor n=1 Tax=Cyanophyceae TaxID=3028117 RepID=UPI0016839C7B|nr:MULTISPECIES: response regulator transcription factor [unclassified Coleofasciculus]MBD1838618.1 response regulator transcription factor [Coleofasciculus sp. FACHB-501]MBD1889767.1 response regulator transcription factor [Coleofasciculus sp. FACHB-SPT9]MBD1897757.1 response regulator transcription factor [Coleofasciculus sp. FACHB-129]MBD2045853.1 response regulator transcription factor [Coleofasciculus sp. FACHB-64]MBD2540919.1 response regulator transcription factor [Coleofasciculus sp. F